MAAPTFTLINHTDIDLAESTTGWYDFDTLDTDIKKEGSNGITGTFRADGETGYFTDGGGAPVTAVGKTFRAWINTTNVPYLTTEAGGGAELLMNDGATSEYKTMFGLDTYFGGWFYIVWDMNEFTTLTLANVERWGFRQQLSSNAKNIDNWWMDALRYLDGYSMTGGTSGDEITFTEIEAADRGTTTLYGYGVVQQVEGVFYASGEIQFGTGATTTWFKSDGAIVVFIDKPVAAGLYSLAGVGTGTRVDIQNSVFRGGGTTDATRFILDMSDSNLLSCTFAANLVVRAAAVSFKSGQTVIVNTFDDCGQIIAGGANFSGGTVKNYEGAPDTAAFSWNSATETDGLMDDMTFKKGAAPTHAIEFTTFAADFTLNDIAFGTAWGAEDSTSATLYFPDSGSDRDWVINLSGCTGTITYRKIRAGDTVTLVIDPVTTTVTVKDAKDLAVIENARVMLIAKDATGPLPYEESVTSITRSGAVATVTHTAHGLATGDFVYIRGADQDEYNVCVEVTYLTTDTYTFAVNGTPGDATGIIIATGGYFNTLTNASGVVTNTRSITSNQPLNGWARKGSTSPYYKSGLIDITTDSGAGVTTTTFLLRDE